jgi:hypothetical protein
MSLRVGPLLLPVEPPLVPPEFAGSGLLEFASVLEQPANAKAKPNPTQTRVPTI